MRESTAPLVQLPPERMAARAVMYTASEAGGVVCAVPDTPKTTQSPSGHKAEFQPYEEDAVLWVTHTRRNHVDIRPPDLPCELWCHIFMECRQMVPWMAVVVSHVCRTWREVALEHRALWNRIDLSRGEKRLDRASTWAERSHSFPVDLTIRCSESADRRNMIPWLREKGSHIRSMSILHMHRGQNRLLPSLPAFQRMERLWILGLQECDLDMGWISRVLEGSPELRSLSLAGVCGLHRPEVMSDVAAQLTHLSFGARSQIDYEYPLWVDAVLAVVSTCINLRSLECYALADEGDDPSTASLPWLSSLSIGDSDETCVILKYLYTPRLRYFRLVHEGQLDENEKEVEPPITADDSRHEYGEFLIECLRDLFLACSPQIVTVVWDRTTMDIGVLDCCTAYLQAMEEVQCRGLKKLGGISQHGFLVRGVGGGLCPYPRLRSISLTECTLERFELDWIMTAISLRGSYSSDRKTEFIVKGCRGLEDIHWSRTSNEGVDETSQDSSRPPEECWAIGNKARIDGHRVFLA